MKKWLAIFMAGTFLLSSSSVFGQAARPVPAGQRPGVYPTPKGEDPPRHKKEGSEFKGERPKEKAPKPVPGQDAGKSGSPFKGYMEKHKIP